MARIIHSEKMQVDAICFTEDAFIKFQTQKLRNTLSKSNNNIDRSEEKVVTGKRHKRWPLGASKAQFLDLSADYMFVSSL